MVQSAVAQQAETQSDQPVFGGVYADLTPRQKELVDDLYSRFSELTGLDVDPEETYDSARLSARTTFEAVTHALHTSVLTDENGAPLGTALDLIEHLETIHGKIRGARSDHQFRMYVRLKEVAVDVLERSKEFARGADNTVYHKGYPINYRQAGGVPSIQFSVTTDLERADIDVDYRSAKFPAAIFNGHLTASNSDVRAGNNLDRHNGRWEGFVDWWRGLFQGRFSADAYRGERPDRYEIPAVPRAGKKSIEVAVRDFLSAWLVEGEPLVATSYMSDRAFECMAIDTGEEEVYDYGMAPVQMAVGLKAINDELGKVERLEDVITGVRLTNPALMLVRHKHHAEFVLYGIQADLAAAFDCANRTKVGKAPRLRPAPRNASFEDFEYFGTTFYLERPKGRGETIALLWTKEFGHWKIVSYEVEPHGAGDDTGKMPDVRPDVEAPEMKRVAGDPDLITATQGFLESWLIEKDIDKTLGYMDPSSFACVNLNLAPGETPKDTADEQRDRMRLGLTRSSEHLGSVAKLEDIIRGVDVFVPDVRIVSHSREEAYSLYGLPDWKGENARCRARIEGIQASPPEGREPSYGRFYVSGLHIETVAGETVALLLGWTKVDGAWRIYTYKVVEP
jgi:hypothetical protein